MTGTFTDIDNTIIEVVRENLRSLPKNAISVRTETAPPKKTPAISVWSPGFTISDLAISAEEPPQGEIVRDEFNGDGKKVTFKLSTLPLRPLLSVKSPRERTVKEGLDFTTEYRTGVLKFHEPPASGTKNLVVQYYSGRSAAEVQGQRITFQYFMDIWSTKPDEENLITEGVISAFIKSRELLSSKGMKIRLRGGSELTQKEGLPDGLFCKRIDLTVDADLLVRAPITRIEKVEVSTSEGWGTELEPIARGR